MQRILDLKLCDVVRRQNSETRDMPANCQAQISVQVFEKKLSYATCSR